MKNLTLYWTCDVIYSSQFTVIIDIQHTNSEKILNICRTIPAQYLKFRRIFCRTILRILPHHTAQFAISGKCGAAQFAIFCRT